MTVGATELVLVRHGETDWNKEHRMQGQQYPGPPLNEQGFKQCQVLCQVLQQRYSSFDAVVSSDLLRATQTADVLAAAYGLQVTAHPGLRERHFGLLQGLTYEAAPAAQPQAWAVMQGSCVASRIPGGGESLQELDERIAAALLDIAAANPGKRVLLVSHGGVMHAVHRVARGSQATDKVANCCINAIMAVPCSSTQQQQQQQQPSLQVEAVSAHTAAADQFDSCCIAKASSNSHSIDLQVNCNSTAACVPSSCCGANCGENTKCSCRAIAPFASEHEGAAAAAGGWRQQPCGGRLLLSQWNDGHELASHGFVDALSFGGGFKEA
uniref:Phosphoglycerate mutase-like protein n=1 Tax=Tetradesmus obliquus TaxID=3088 RepID=A0A383V9P9_TETOB|eukprot:jgi/Sobl393_1/3046/SZX61066.1